MPLFKWTALGLVHYRRKGLAGAQQSQTLLERWAKACVHMGNTPNFYGSTVPDDSIGCGRVVGLDLKVYLRSIGQMDMATVHVFLSW